MSIIDDSAKSNGCKFYQVRLKIYIKFHNLLLEYEAGLDWKVHPALFFSQFTWKNKPRTFTVLFKVGIWSELNFKRLRCGLISTNVIVNWGNADYSG